MPTHNERVPNKPLTGREVRELITRDTAKLLENFGLLSDHLAFYRISYDIRVRLHVDNLLDPTSETWTESRPAPPLDHPARDQQIEAIERSRQIVSPNEERLRAGLPIPVTVRNPAERTVAEHDVQYPPQPQLGEGTVREVSVEDEARAAWKILDEPQEVRVEVKV
jgi:hypothetical protein